MEYLIAAAALGVAIYALRKAKKPVYKTPPSIDAYTKKQIADIIQGLDDKIEHVRMRQYEIIERVTKLENEA